MDKLDLEGTATSGFHVLMLLGLMEGKASVFCVLLSFSGWVENSDDKVGKAKQEAVFTSEKEKKAGFTSSFGASKTHVIL